MKHPAQHPLCCLAAALPCAVALAQPTQTITISGRAAPATSVAGFGDVPLARAPWQGAVATADQLAEWGGPSGLTQTHPALADAYSTEGYWAGFSARGYVLDARSNYRRDGLPMNAETAIALANKDRIELLLGTSGLQAGTSAPGGLVNYVVKRPNGAQRSARLEWRESGTLGAALDWTERFGADGAGGLRLNAAASRLDPQAGAAEGSRHVLALAAEWRLAPGQRIEAEIESSRQSQPSVPGLSLFGDRLPSAREIDPRINLNRQPWTQPVVFAGHTASLRWQGEFGRFGAIEATRVVAHAARQRLRTDDRVAFPFGCYDANTDTYLADRYCADGRFDLYDFRSDGERRRTDAAELSASGRIDVGAWRHHVSISLVASRQSDELPPQAFNPVGQGQIGRDESLPASPDLFGEVVRRRERSTELALRDRIDIAQAWSIYAGLRHTRLRRGVDQSFGTPWLGLVWRPTAATMVYASAGQGIESEAVPNRPRYVNPGALLPALRSRQAELGAKHITPTFEAGAALFDIRRPVTADFGTCDTDASCERRIDGAARHRGIEASAQWRSGPWTLQGGALWLAAQREGSAQTGINGLRPVNVPRRALRARIGHDLAAVPALNLSAALHHEGPREVLPDNSLTLPGWTRIDLAARWATTLAGNPAVVRLGLDNTTDRRAWRESPYQFGHAYLFPLAPRGWRASVQWQI